jgi:hypothetical protein
MFVAITGLLISPKRKPTTPTPSRAVGCALRGLLPPVPCFVPHEEAHDISFLIVMPQISHRGKRHRLPSYLLHSVSPHINAVAECASCI